MHLQNLARAAALSVTFDGGVIPIMQPKLSHYGSVAVLCRRGQQGIVVGQRQE
jgi:hypothetical protein